MITKKIKEGFATDRRCQKMNHKMIKGNVIRSQIELWQSVDCAMVFDIGVERKRNVRIDATSCRWIRFNSARLNSSSPDSSYDLGNLCHCEDVQKRVEKGVVTMAGSPKWMNHQRSGSRSNHLDCHRHPTAHFRY